MTRRAALLAPLAFLLVPEMPYLVSGAFLAGLALMLTIRGLRGVVSPAESHWVALEHGVSSLLHACLSAFVPIVATSILFLEASTSTQVLAVAALLLTPRRGSTFAGSTIAFVAFACWIFGEVELWLLLSIVAGLALAPRLPERSSPQAAMMRACWLGALAAWICALLWHQMLDPLQLLGVFLLGALAGVPLPSLKRRGWMRL